MMDLETPRQYCFSLPERSAINNGNADNGKWCDECNDFVECQKARENRPRIFTLHLKETYFEEIRSGKKKEEYRMATTYWRTRILGKNGGFDVVEICKGYPARGNIDDRMWFRYEGCVLGVRKWANGGEINDGMTFIIPLRERLNYPYEAMITGCGAAP